MGSDVVAEELLQLPLLAPLKTAAVKEKPVEGPGEATGGAATKEEEEEEEEGCVTPTAAENMIKPALVCPPAPRKPRPAKRKAGEDHQPLRGFYAVPRDLTSVFLAMPCPPKKRIRAGYANWRFYS